MRAQLAFRAPRCPTADDDCDEAIDEELGLGLGDSCCSAGVGACRVSGEQVCACPDSVTCDAVAGEPGTEVCNTLDDNCDGTVDEAGCASSTV